MSQGEVARHPIAARETRRVAERRADEASSDDIAAGVFLARLCRKVKLMAGCDLGPDHFTPPAS